MTIGRSRFSKPPWNALAALLITGLWAWAPCAVGVGAAQGPSLAILPTSPLQVKPEGRNALLTCRAQGDGAKHVTRLRWRSPDGREVPQPPPGELSRPKVYAESFQADGSLSLIFTELKFQDEGNYTCEGQYAGGDMLFRSVEIRVIKAIRWVDAPTEQWPKQGEAFKVRCKVEAEPPPTVDWQKDGAPLGARYQVETDGVRIPDPQPQDDGVYTCRAIVVATGELQTRPIKVEVQVPPSFAEAERNVTVSAEKHETVPCHADGRPPPEYSWIYERTSADLAEQGGRFQVDGLSGELRVSPVHADDDGAYWCVARNRAGEVRQRVHVAVLVPPRVSLVHNATAVQGKRAEVKCEARGRPLPAVEWRRHNSQHKFVPGQQGDDKRIATSSLPAGREHPDRTDGVLSWDEVYREDDGLYECIATNQAGTAHKLAHLTVEFKPSFNNTPYNHTWSWDGHTANITCLAESIPNATISWFFNDRDIEKDKINWLKKVGNGPQSWLEVSPGQDYRYGSYKCRATNKHGVTDHSIELKKAERPGPLLQAVVDQTTATTLKFKLVGPRDSGGMPTRAYSVRYREADVLGDPFLERSWPAESDYTVENLEPQTHYSFEFRATNDVGEGPWSAKITKVMPKRSVPEPPPLVHLAAMAAHPDKPMDRTDAPLLGPYATHFELKWRIPADNGEPLLRYIVSWCKAKESAQGHWEQDASGPCDKRTLDFSPHVTSLWLRPLRADTLYVVHLHATNMIGTSRPSALLLKTPPDHSKGFYDVSMSTSAGSPPSPPALLALLLLCAAVALVVPSPHSP